MSRANHPPCVRRGFTLVEILVVVGIIAALVALVTPAVMGVRRSARIAAIKTEIDLLGTAFEKYKQQYGDYPPCFVDRVRAQTADDSASAHLRKIFPQPTNYGPVSQSQLLGYMNTNPGVPFRVLFSATSQSLFIGMQNAAVIWLRGYTDDPTRPVLSTTGTVTVVSGSWMEWASLVSGVVVPTGMIQPRRPVFAFDESRIASDTAPNPLQYSPPGLPASPYFYIDHNHYGMINAATGPTIHPSTGTTTRILAYSGTTALQLTDVGAHRVPRRPLRAKPTASTPDAWYFTAAGSGTNAFFNPGSFQILCAGLDGIFGTDDDLSNFWPGTRREYLDSLRTQ